MPKTFALLTSEIVLGVIDKSLSALGEGPRKAIWYHLEKDFKFARHGLPENIDEFEEAMKKFFGSGYDFLDNLFRRHLQQVTEQDLNCYKTFADCVRTLCTKVRDENT